jgi:uncharacterized protein YciI
MLFALICTDKPNSLELRQQSRPEHLKFLEGLGGSLKAAGPFTDDEGKPTGSLVVIEAANRAAIAEIAARDPYAIAGLFASVEIKPWKWLIKNPEAQ